MSKEKWIRNQRIKKKREMEKAHFEKTQSLKVLEALNKKREMFESQVIGCLDEFENILSKTQKLQKDESQEIAASEVVQNDKVKTDETDIASVDIVEENPLDHLEKLR